MKERIPNILRAGVILMVLTVWLPTAAVLVHPHENEWVENHLGTAYARDKCIKRPKFCPNKYTCEEWEYRSKVDWDGWMICGPITFGLLAGLYLTAGSLSLRPQRLQVTEQ